MLHRVELTRRRQEFVFHADSRPFYVRFDKGSWIPKLTRQKKKPSEWIAIANSDTDVTGRRDAVRALGSLAAEAHGRDSAAHQNYVGELANRMRRDQSEWIRAHAAQALGRAGGVEAREWLVAAAGQDPAERVRCAALRALCRWEGEPKLAELARSAFDGGFSWNVMGAAAGLLCAADPQGAYAWITEKLFIESPHDQLRAHLIEHLGTLSNPGVNDQLLRWMRDGSVHPTARAVAVRQLARQHSRRASNVKTISQLLGTESFRLSRAVVEALAEMGDPASRNALRAYYPDALTSRERRIIEGVLLGEGL